MKNKKELTFSSSLFQHSYLQRKCLPRFLSVLPYFNLSCLCEFGEFSFLSVLPYFNLQLSKHQHTLPAFSSSLFQRIHTQKFFPVGALSVLPYFNDIFSPTFFLCNFQFFLISTCHTYS